MSTDSVKMDTGIPLFCSEIQYLLLETIPLETIMRVHVLSSTNVKVVQNAYHGIVKKTC